MRPFDLHSPDIPRLLLRTGGPAMAGLALNATHQSVDAIFLGTLGTQALAAVGLTAPLSGLTAALGVGLGVGAATAIGRRLGAGTAEQASRIASAAMGLALCVAALCALLLSLGREPLLDLLGATAEIRVPARDYLRLLALVAGLGVIQILCDFIAIGEGNARFSMLSLGLCFGLNMVLDALFIFGFGWGVTGAAAATVVAQLVTLTLYGWYFRHGPGRIRLRPVFGLRAWRVLIPVLRVGAPETATVLAMTGAVLLLYRIAGATAGIEGLAALTVVLRLFTLACLPVEGFCLGAQAVLAHAAGAGNGARLGRAVQCLAAMTCGPAALAGSLILALPDLALGLFSPSPEAAALADPALSALALVLPLVALRNVAQVTLQATERAGTAALLGLAPSGWLLLPLLALLTPSLGFHGIALSLSLAAALAGFGAALILWRLPRTTVNGVSA